MIYLESAIFTTTKVLIDLGIFKALARFEQPRTATQLAHESGADPALIKRLLKLVAVEKFVDEVGPDTYAANDITRCIALPGPEGAIEDMFMSQRTLSDFPEFLKENKYANPTDKDNSGWMYGRQTKQHYFEYINSPGQEKKLEVFRKHMAFKTVGLKWFEVPQIMDSVFGTSRCGKDDALLVDVGGSGGHDLIDFRKAHSSLPGRLILQDLPATIDSLNTNALKEHNVEAMGHDFFTPQPVRGAKVYYLKMVLHDWPAKQCIEILSQLRVALRPGYSKIVLNELVIPDQNAGWFETSVDVLMMHVHSAQERREREWRELIGRVDGLKIVKIWDVEGAVEKVIEIDVV
ncbi:hypothetical protein VTL71DRAFT_15190 [Oculimacula yallundae]|uniref:O-methyltransferase domain-containing protein n=1 Tax=Oculimacula yallundae TaxID=86028 RepID=A0ABR4CH54_9HELO